MDPAREIRTSMPRAWLSLALGLALYALLWPLQPFDVRTFLIPWTEHIVAAGPVGAFAHPFSNYAPPYLYLLAAISPLAALITVTGAIKLVSALGSLWLAWAAYRLLRAAGAVGADRAAALTILLPTALLNAALLGQCDALWAAPCLLAVGAAIERRPGRMLLWCGIAFAFKLQAIFLAPFALAVLLAERAPWRLWLIPPAVYAAAMLPAWLAGWPAADLATIYLRQAGYYDALAMNAPNLWQIVTTLAGPLPLEPVAFAFAALASLAFLFRFARDGAMPDPIAAALLSALLLPGLLPRMHDRYFFLADLLAFVLAVSWRRRDGWLIFAAVQIGSLLALWSGMSGDPAFATAGGVAMLAATGALLMRLVPAPRGGVGRLHLIDWPKWPGREAED